MMRYSPGGRQKWLHTSRRLMKVSERAAEQLRRKKSLFRCTCFRPEYWKMTHAVRLHEGALHLPSDVLFCVIVFVYIPPQAARKRQKQIKCQNTCKCCKYEYKNLHYHLKGQSLPHRWQSRWSPCPDPFSSYGACSSASSPQ